MKVRNYAPSPFFVQMSKPSVTLISTSSKVGFFLDLFFLAHSVSDQQSQTFV